MSASYSGRPSRAARYRARWILPVSAPPIEHGELEVGDDGRIVRVGVPAESTDGPPLTDLGEAILLPGLVNTHAHPELTVLRGSLEGLAFDEWIERIIALKYDRLRPEEIAAATRWGVAEAARAGVTSIGMIDDTGYGPEALERIGLRGVCYLEFFGPDPTSADRAFGEFRERFEELRDRFAAQSERPAVEDAGGDRPFLLGISPHSPYTVSAPLLERALRYARDGGIPLTIHSSESHAETEFVSSGSGPLAGRLRSRGIEVAASGRSPLGWLADRGAVGKDILLAHCVQLSGADIETLSRSGSAVAHCPVSNAKLGHGIAPIAELIDRGVRVGIGSDSVATNNRIDMFGEARTGALLQAVSEGNPSRAEPEGWIRMLTLGGAEALGLGRETGSLEPGKWADLTAVSLESAHLVPAPDPYAALLFSADPSDVTLTVVAGETVFREGHRDRLFSTSDRSLLEEAAERIRD